MKIRIVGSMKFYDKFLKARSALEAKGNTIILPPKDRVVMDKEIKRKQMEKFLQDLTSVDAVLVMNFDKDSKTRSYVGANTLMEIGMAFLNNKKIYVLNTPPESCKEELEALDCVYLNGDINRLY